MAVCRKGKGGGGGQIVLRNVLVGCELVVDSNDGFFWRSVVDVVLLAIERSDADEEDRERVVCL